MSDSNAAISLMRDMGAFGDGAIVPLPAKDFVAASNSRRRQRRLPPKGPRVYGGFPTYPELQATLARDRRIPDSTQRPGLVPPFPMTTSSVLVHLSCLGYEDRVAVER